MLKQLRWKLTTIYAAIFVLILVSLAGYILYSLQGYFYSNLEKELLKEARLSARMVEGNLDNWNITYMQHMARTISRETGTRITIIDSSGYIIGDSRENTGEVRGYLDRREIRRAMENGEGVTVREGPERGARYMFAAARISGEDNDPAGVLRVSAPLDHTGSVFVRLWEIVFLTATGGVVIVVLVGRILGKQVAEPVEQLIHFARRFSRGDFKYRAPVKGNDEIGELAGTLNKMAATIEEKVKQASEGKNTLETILASMNSGVIFVNREGFVKLVNPAAEKFLSFSRSSEATQLPYDVVIKNQYLTDVIERSLTNGEMVEEEVENIDKELSLEVITSPIYDNSGILSGVVTVLHDITQIRSLEKMRTEFVANVSHELKTPVTSIKGFTETLLDGAMYDQETCREFVQIIDSETDRLKNLIQDILELSKIEAKQVQLEYEHIDILSIARSAVEKLKGQAENAGVKVFQSFPENPVVAEVDRDMIEQVMINLVDNAVKYTQYGGKIEVQVKEESYNVVVWVKDNGLGIPSEDRDRIFERFYRVEKARSRALGGTGLGLSIVKHIVEAHNGSVGVNSNPGRGSEFFFTVPKKQ